MNQFKRAQVIMLPTENKSSLELDLMMKSLRNDISYNHNCYTQLQHLYVINDDEIKEGDWCLDLMLNLIQQVKDKSGYIDDNKNGAKWRKIIATTDILLKIDNPNYDISKLAYISLPQPSQQFIKKYIESYNKGEVITDVLLEYEFNNFKFMSTLCTTKEKEYNIKVNPKDNTITIKKLKDSWNREEVESLIRLAFEVGYERSNSGYPHTDNHTKPKIDKWIKENL